MVFNYKWSDKKNGNFAIKKRNSKGIRIELKRNQQTEDTHYFILVENDTESMYNAMRGLNIILETINFDYRQKGTNKKSGNPYLTKKDIENIIVNIDQYRNKTITIEITPPNESSKKIKKIIDENSKTIKGQIQLLYGYPQYKSILNMLIKNIKKKQELKEKQLETEKQIKELKKDLLKTEKTINADIEKFEKVILTLLNNKKGTSKFQMNLNVLYVLAMKELRDKNAREAQQRYRDSKNEKEGKPKRKAGRPRKTEK